MGVLILYLHACPFIQGVFKKEELNGSGVVGNICGDLTEYVNQNSYHCRPYFWSPIKAFSD